MKEELMRKNKELISKNRTVPLWTYLMRKHTGASLSEIGNRFVMRSYSSVSSVIQRMEQALREDVGLRKRIADVEAILP
jgi:chromosomal replication initiation ATPase DnaA